MSPARIRPVASAAALVVSGLAVGGVLAGTMSANAAETPSPSSSATAPAAGECRGPGRGLGGTPNAGAETTGTALTRVTAAIKAKNAGATVERVNADTRSGGYLAHVKKADGTTVHVLVSKAFAVTGEEAHGGGPKGTPAQAATPTA